MAVASCTKKFGLPTKDACTSVWELLRVHVMSVHYRHCTINIKSATQNIEFVRACAHVHQQVLLNMIHISPLRFCQHGLALFVTGSVHFPHTYLLHIFSLRPAVQLKKIEQVYITVIVRTPSVAVAVAIAQPYNRSITAIAIPTQKVKEMGVAVEDTNFAADTHNYFETVHNLMCPFLSGPLL